MVYVLFVYAVIAVSLSIGNMIITLFETENETNVLYVAFFRQIETYWELDDDLNAVGIIIVLFLESLFIFPSNVILLFFKAVDNVAQVAWDLFKQVFRKRSKIEEGEHERAD